MKTFCHYRHGPGEEFPTNGIVGLINDGEVQFSHDCAPLDGIIPDEFGSGQGGGGGGYTGNGNFQAQYEQWENELTFSKPELIWTNTMIEALLDGGSTMDLVNLLNWNQDTWSMRILLLKQSPYLTIDALLEVANNTLVYPHPIALEIFMANPDVLNNFRFLSYLSTKDNPMPEYMIDILLASSNTTTLRKTLANINARHHSRVERSNGLIARTYLRNPDSNPKRVFEMISESGTLNGEFIIMDGMLDAKKMSHANARFNTLIDRISTTGQYNKSEMDAFDLWIDFREALITSNTDWASLSVSQKNNLQTFARNSDTWVGQRAAGLLNEYYHISSFVPPAFIDITRREIQTTAQKKPSSLRFYPTPADQFLNIQMSNDLVQSNHPAFLNIFDLTGQLVQSYQFVYSTEMKTLDVRQWQTGLYFYTLELPYGKIENGKLEIIH